MAMMGDASSKSQVCDILHKKSNHLRNMQNRVCCEFDRLVYPFVMDLHRDVFYVSTLILTDVPAN